MALADDLERIAGAASGHGEVSGCSRPSRLRPGALYLVALDAGEEPHWLVLDDTGAIVERREVVRAAASIVAMSELAAELAGGGDLEQLRSQLVQVRMVEQTEGIEEAEAAALALEQVVGPTAGRLAGLSRRGRGRDTGARTGARRAHLAFLAGAARRDGCRRGVRPRRRARLPRRPSLTWMHGRWIRRLPVRR